MMKTQCPACPDGNEWGANGPTGRVCRVCGGKAYIEPAEHKADADHPDQDDFMDQSDASWILDPDMGAQ